jgi:hypothetical protein
METKKKPTDFGQLLADSNHSHYGLMGRTKGMLLVVDKHVDRHPILYRVLAAAFMASLVLVAINLHFGRLWF